MTSSPFVLGRLELAAARLPKISIAARERVRSVEQRDAVGGTREAAQSARWRTGVLATQELAPRSKNECSALIAKWSAG